MTPQHLSFATQAMRYFLRPHDSIRREPLEVPAAWRGPEVEKRGDYVVELSAGDIAELERAADGVVKRGIALAELGRDEFPLPTLAPRLAEWARELGTGRGLMLLRGLPVERWGEERSSLVYWGLAHHLGEPGAQNGAGDLLGHVLDTGEDASDPFVRRYRTAGDIRYHCDLADVVGLLCLRPAKSGGASRIVSSVAVYNELVRRRPDLVERLYEPFFLDARGDQGDDGPKYVPIPPCRHAAGVLRTFFHSDYFRSAPRHEGVPPLSDSELELLDLYESIASSPELRLDMEFRPGDIQLISNHFVLHARTAYEDFAEPARRRHLLRLWLSLRTSAG
jgi:hypothetical protein